MEKKNSSESNPRREFIGTVAAGAAALGISSLISPFNSSAANNFIPATNMDADEWFAQIKGKHKIVFDCTEPLDGPMPFAWAKVFLLTNEATGTPSKENSVVMILRHEAIPYAFNSDIWAKYNFGEVFKANDPKTKSPSTRNPFWKPAVGDFQVPGIGNVEVGINELQDVGVMFCVCNMAMTVYSAVIAEQMKLNAADVMKEWMAGLLPGVQVVPSGVWAVGRAQEHGCAYCKAG